MNTTSFLSRAKTARFFKPLRMAPFVSLSLFLSLGLFLPPLALAGHGFASAFGNMEWIPEPGRTPDSVLYRLDAVQEQSQLLLARTSSDKIQLCLTFAREKLAEIEAMVRAENTVATTTAATQYLHYIDHAKAVIDKTPDETDTLADALATALLEHQYILSVLYPELPVSTRANVLQTIAAAQERYQEIAKRLSAKKKGALFFKEEEVRWSVDMAKREDEGKQTGKE